MSSKLSNVDEEFIQYAINLSRSSLKNEGKTPFGAIVVIGEEIIGEGTSSVIELHDPTAHAEITALRSAGRTMHGHILDDATMYSSSEPCPMCLIACYWAHLKRLVFGATSHDVAVNGFEDLQLYRELTRPADERTLQAECAEGALREQATGVLQSWASRLPTKVVPKL